MRPTRRMSPAWAMPLTMVRNTTGPITMRIRRMKPSPSGFIAVPVSGAQCPTAMPMAIAVRTWTVRFVWNGRLARLSTPWFMARCLPFGAGRSGARHAERSAHRRGQRHGEQDGRGLVARVAELPRLARREADRVPGAEDFRALRGCDRDRAGEHDVMLLQRRGDEVGAAARQQVRDAEPQLVRLAGLMALQPEAAHAAMIGRGQVAGGRREARDLHSVSTTRSRAPASTDL